MASKYMTEMESYKLLTNKFAKIIEDMTSAEIRDSLGTAHLYVYRMALNTLGHTRAVERIDEMPQAGNDPVG